jgi:TolB-like protein
MEAPDEDSLKHFGPRGSSARLGSRPALAVLVLGVAALAVWWWVQGPAPDEAASARPEARVVVFPFEDLSGDAALEGAGDYAAFGIIDGLSWMDGASVVSRDAVLRALQMAGDSVNTQEIAAELGAGTKVTGLLVSSDDSLEFRAEVSAVTSGEVIHTAEASGRTADLAEVVESLRQRVMGAVATMLGPDRGTTYLSRPPTYEAYQAWARGVERFWARDFEGALDRHREAYRLDTTFVNALFGMALQYSNLGQPAKVDSLVGLLEARRSELRPLHGYWLDYYRASLAGDWMSKVEAQRAQLRLDPESWTSLVMTAVGAGRPNEALQLWEDFQEGRLAAPRRAPALEWPAFWGRVAAAQHMTARYPEQLATARRARAQFPEYPGVRLHEIQALFALDRFEEAYGLLEEVEKAEGPGAFGPFYWVAADLLRHGYDAEGREVAHRAVSWLRSRDPESLKGEIAVALLLAGRPEEALPLIREVATQNPDIPEVRGLLGIALARTGDRPGAEAEARWLEELDLPYSDGYETELRASIAANLDQNDMAVRLLRQAIQEGLSFEYLHCQPLLAPLWGYEPFEQVIAPRG